MSEIIHYGLSGAHRVGKSRLQHVIADQQGITVLQMPTQKTIEGSGHTLRAEYSYAERLDLQYRVLNAYQELLEENVGYSWISDRTPIDTVAYLLADVQRSGRTEQEEQRTIEYIDRALALTVKHYHGILVIQPGIKIVDDPTSSQPSPAYIEHLSAIIAGYTQDIGGHILSRSLTDLDARVSYVSTALGLVRRFGPTLLYPQPIPCSVIARV